MNFNTLPSSQGWIYSNSGQPALELAVFSVAGGALQQNTIGIGGGVPGSTGYRLFDVIDPLSPFSISMRARFLEEEKLSSKRSAFRIRNIAVVQAPHDQHEFDDGKDQDKHKH